MHTYGLDISLAVTAGRVLFLETHTKEKRDALVWAPLQCLLDELSRKDPQQITCLRGKHFIWPQNSIGAAADIFLVAERKVAYLGTLFGFTGAQMYRLIEVRRLSSFNPELAKKLANASRHAIIRDAHFCIIPTNSDMLTTGEATQAI